jgi:opacity protein-like surface antigen/outer membrane protease
MKTKIAGSAFAVALVSSLGAQAADLPVKAPPPIPVYNWTGGYVGVHVGAGIGRAHFSDPFGPSIFGDNVRTPAFLGGGQIGYNWQAPGSHWVVGVEGDVSGLDSVGTNTCLAFSGFFISANCRIRPEATATLTGRVGFTAGPEGRTLFYAKGGLAWIRDSVDIVTNGAFITSAAGPDQTSAGLSKWGGTVGVGVEQALTPAWSMKLEYDYLGFGGSNVATPPSAFLTPAGFVLTPGGFTSVSQNIQEVKIGVNYRFGADPRAGWPLAAPAYPVKGLYKAPPPPVVAAGGWEVEVGPRYWYSWGRFQKDLGGLTTSANANFLVSRLTYDTTANSGELFGRVETPWNFFLKGFIGTGKLASGHMNDEDWVIFGGTVPYSNTLSDPVKGGINYATIDAGYDFYRDAFNKLGVFIGYNYYKENKAAFGCVQIANPFSDCVPAIPNTVLGITENDKWQSLRLGVAGEIMVYPGLKLSGDVAYLPYVKFNGLDIHWLRTDVPSPFSPETGNGRGVQLEGILSYAVTPSFNVGVGGRYWAMWTNDNAFTNIFSTPCPCQTLPSKTQRAGMFLQASYKFGEPGAVVAKY